MDMAETYVGIIKRSAVSHMMWAFETLAELFCSRQATKKDVEFGRKWEKEVVQVRGWESGTVRRVERF